MQENIRKTIKVLYSPDFDEAYKGLLEETVKEKERGLENSFNMQLLKAIDRTLELLKLQPDYGIHVPKKLIPAEFITRYEINNLWKINLPDGWRLLYTLNTGKAEILTILLEYMDHARYNKLFGYRKR